MDIAKQTSLFGNESHVPINKLHSTDKENLLSIISHLNKSGFITIQRMFFTCQYFKADKNGQKHPCELLNSKLANSELLIECEKHLLKDKVLQELS